MPSALQPGTGISIGLKVSGLAHQGAENRRSRAGWQDLGVIIRLDRDSVAAGDDVESHDLEREVDQRRPFERFVHDLIWDGYLPTPASPGGRSTWVARKERRGEPLAVIATRFGRLDSVTSSALVTST